MSKHLQQDWYDPNPDIDRSIYVPMTCTTCGVERDIMDFYDGKHSVNIVRKNDVDVEFLIDHGELVHKKSSQEVQDSGI